MTQQATEVPHVANTWNAVGFFRWLWSGCQTIVGWFYSDREEYPNDEAGSLMRGFMSNKSWFDKISSGWSEQSFLSKAGYISAFIITSSFVGSLLGSSLIYTISAVIISIVTHKLLVAHQANRWQNARILAAQTINLNGRLSASQALFEKATNDMQTAHAEMRSDSGLLQDQAKALTIESDNLHFQNEVLIDLVKGLEIETAPLITSQQAVNDEFKQLKDDLKIYQEAIQHSQEGVTQIEQSAAEFANAVNEMQKNQLKLADAVDTICFFAKERPHFNKTDPSEEEMDETIAALMREADEHGKFIASMTGQ